MGRTKPVKPATELYTNEEYLKIEISHLRTRNHEFAKANTELKNANRLLQEQCNLLQRENMQLQLDKRNYGHQKLKLQKYSKMILSNVAKVADDAAHIIYEISSEEPPPAELVNNIEAVNKSAVNKSNGASTSKTQAVKPMISGHVIHRPTIILPRIQTEELERLTANSTNELDSFSGISNTSEDDGANPEDENNEEAQSDVEQTVRRLDTLPEINESILSSTNISTELRNGLDAVYSSPNPPFITGIMRDVHLYVPEVPPRVSRRLTAANSQSPQPSTSTLVEDESIAVPTNQSAGRDEADQQPGPSGLQVPSFNGNSSRIFNSSDRTVVSSPQLVHRRKRFEIVTRPSTSPISELSISDSVTAHDGSYNSILSGHFQGAGGESLEALKLTQLGLLGLSPTRQLPTSTPYTPPRVNLRKRPKPMLQDTTPTAKKRRPKRTLTVPMPSCKVMLSRMPLQKRRSSSSGSNSSQNSSMERTLKKDEEVTRSPEKTNSTKSARKAKSKRIANSQSPIEVTSRSLRARRPSSFKEPSLMQKMRR